MSPSMQMSAGFSAESGGGGELTSQEEDWAALSASADMATRFNTEGEVLDYRFPDDDIDYWSWDRTLGWGNGGARSDIPASAGQGGGTLMRRLNDEWGLFTDEGQTGASAAENTTDQGYDEGTVFEFAYAVYVPASWRRVHPNGGGCKDMIISHDSNSNRSFEIVGQATSQLGVPLGYHRNPPNTTGIEEGLSTLCSGSDLNFQPEIDHGADALVNLAAVNPDDMGAWTDCEKTWGRYGYTFAYFDAGFPDAISGTRIWKYWEQLDPDGSDIGPILYPEDDWIVRKKRVTINSYSEATNRIQWYVGRRHHDSWQLIADQQDVLLPTQAWNAPGGGFDIRINACWPNFFHSARTAGAEDTFGVFGFLVSRDVTEGGSIPFPQWWPEQRTSALAIAAANLKPGEWVEMSTTGLAATISGTGGDSGHMLTYSSNGGAYYPDHGRIIFVGGDHDGGPTRTADYDEASNSWSQGPQAGDAGINQNHAHSYNAPDVAGNRHFFVSQDGYLDLATNEWEPITDHNPTTGLGRDNIAFAYMPGVGLFGFGNGAIYLLATPGGSWSTIAEWEEYAFGGVGELGPFALYNPVLNVIWFGGGDGEDNTFIIDDELTVTQLPEPPFDEFSDVNPLPTVGQAVSTQQMYDPVNGDFLVMVAEGSTTIEFYRLVNLTTWTQISSDLSQFSILNGTHPIVIDKYKVIAVLHSTGMSDGEMWLYKPEAS